MPLGSLTVRYDCSDPSSLFQASDGTGAVSAANDPIGRLGDLSGNGRHATASGSARPTYQPATLNGLAIARGNGTTTAMVMPPSSIPPGRSTVYAVAVVRGVASGAPRLLNARSNPDGTARLAIQYNQRTDGDTSHVWLGSISGDSHIITNGASKGTPAKVGESFLISVVSGLEGEGAYVRKNDGPIVVNPDESTWQNPHTTNGTFGWASLFAAVQSATNSFGQWDLGELRIYDGTPTEAEDAAIRAALAAKWGTPTRTPGTYEELAIRSLDAIRSTGPWGDGVFPVHPSAFERTTLKKIDARPPVPPGKRDRDRSLGGNGTLDSGFGGASPNNVLAHNLEDEYGYLALAWSLGGARSAWADDVLGSMLSFSASSPRGLFPMGEHGAYKLENRASNSGLSGQPIGNTEGHLQYESDGYQLDLFEKMVELNPAAVLANFEGVWEHGFAVSPGSRTPGNLDGSRHIDMTGGSSNQAGYLFTRVQGEYIRGFLWAANHDSANAATWHARAELLVDHMMTEGSAPGTAPNLVRTNSVTKATNAMSGTQLRLGVPLNTIHWTTNSLMLASALEDALGEPGIPTGLRTKMETLLANTDNAALSVAHDFGGNGFAAQTMWGDLSVVLDGSDSWVGGYGAYSTAKRMADVIDRWKRAIAAGRTSVASGYAAQITAAADSYLVDDLPPVTEITYPDSYAAAIELMIAAHEIDPQGGYLDFAEEVADRSIADCFDADSDLPRASAVHGWYESLTGGPGLVLALHELATALATPEAIAPGTLSAGTPTSTAVTLSWTDATGGEGVISAQLEWRFSGDDEWAEIWEATSSPVTDDELEAGLSYEYRVRFEDEADQVAYSNVVAVTAPEEPDPDPDPIVAGTLSAGTPTATSVTLTWTAATGGEGALSAQLERAIAGAWAEVSGATASPHPDPGLQPETTYQYRVRWTGSADQLAYSNVVEVTTPGNPAEGFQPGGIPTLQVVTAFSATIAWPGPTGGIGPVVEQLQIRVGDGPWQDVPGATESPELITGLSPATTYTVRAQQTDLGGE